MKCKVITSVKHGLEDEINDWLSTVGDIEISQTTQSSDQYNNVILISEVIEAR